MSVLNILFSLLLVILLIIPYIKRKYRYWENRGVPVVKSSFPKGHLRNVGESEHFSEMCQKSYNELKNQGKPFGGLYFTINPVALALDLDFIKTVLVKDFQNFQDRGFYVNERDDPLWNQLFTMGGEKWKILRSKLSPTFTSGKMKLMFPIITDISEKLILRLNEDISKNSDLELGDYLSRYTMDVIGSCAFGLDCNSIDNPDTEFLKMGRQLFDESKGRAFKRLFTASFKRLSRFLRLKLVTKEVTEYYFKVVKETVAYRENQNIRREDFFNLLIDLKNKGKFNDNSGKDNERITFDEVVSNAFLFLLAGFETSSTTMKFCFLELAHDPKIQDRLRKEVITVLAQHENQITYEALSEMKYLDQVINETLRKHPVGGMTRCPKNDYKVPNSDVILEEGIQVVIPILGIHHDPEYYPDPEKFDPDRFTPEAIKSRHPYAFLAFGEGPRNCIGVRFGMMQMKMGIISLLMNYKFFPCAKTKYPIKYNPSCFVLSPLDNCWLTIEKL